MRGRRHPVPMNANPDHSRVHASRTNGWRGGVARKEKLLARERRDSMR